VMDHRGRWRVPAGVRPALDAIETRSTEGAPGDKDETVDASKELIDELATLQTRLWAEQQRSVLLVLQAMDAGGKDGTVRRVFTGVNPQGVHVTSFKAPNETELAHDFLWRVHRRTPARGEIGVFNRSHYEDVLIARVEGLVPEETWRHRYDAIRAFERNLVAEGTTICKVFLHISKEEQAERFRSRLDDPDKRWKFTSADLEGRDRWDDYQLAYADAVAETTTDDAPWFVIPADRKWFRDWAVLEVLVETLRDLDPQYPAEERGLDDVVID
jgi:PPK2 family polyphosphate:nucleotide phosphotransferase